MSVTQIDPTPCDGCGRTIDRAREVHWPGGFQSPTLGMVRWTACSFECVVVVATRIVAEERERVRPRLVQ